MPLRPAKHVLQQVKERKSEHRHARVLLIDDDSQVYIVIKKYLDNSRSGTFTLEWFATYEDGCSALERGDFDVCLLDHQLNDKSGLDLLKQAKQSGCQQPIIFLSSYHDYQADREALDNGACDYLVKDTMDEKGLRRALHYALERKKVEELLRYQLQFRRYFDLPLIGMAVLSPQLHWIEVNRKLCEMLGYAKAQLTALTWNELTHPKDLEKESKKLAKLLAGEIGSYSLDKRFVCKNSEVLEASVSVGCVRQANNPIECLVVLVQNITKRNETKRALQHQKTYLRQLIDAIPHLIYVKDEKGRYTLANQAAADLFGADVSAIIGKTDAELGGTQENIGQLTQDDRVVLEKLTTSCLPEQPLLHAGLGQTRWFQTIKKPVRADHQQAHHLLGIATDLTERKLAEDALRVMVEGTASSTAEDFFHSLVRHLAGVLGAKRAFVGKLVYPAAERIRTLAIWKDNYYAENEEYLLAGSPSEEIVGKSLRYYADNLQALFPRDSSLVRHGVRSYMGAPIYDSTGRPLGILAVWDDKPLRDWQAGRWILSIFAARAGAELERLMAEQESRSLQRQLLHAQKMEAIGQLAAGVAHDLNNALGAVVGHLQLMKMDAELAADSRSSVDTALSGCERASSLIQQLLGFSRHEKYNLEELSLPQILADTIKFLARIIGKDIKIDIHNASNDIIVMGDAGQLQQALTNLIINATHAMPRGGTITFSFASRYIKSPKHYNLKSLPGAYVLLSIADTGAGIAPKNLEKIFEPFFTTKESARGTGLGLAMVYGIMQNHGGWMDVKSEVDKGSTFSMCLPLVRKEEKSYRIEEETVMHEASGKVLVIDDEPSLVDLAVRFLEKAGLQGQGFASAEDALAWYRENFGAVDMVVLDMKMPGTSGEECFETLRGINPQARIVILSGYIHDDAAETLMHKGALKFFQKPLQYPELVKWIAENINK